MRLSYADMNGDGVIQPATEILKENNYYPFGLEHTGYNDLSGAHGHAVAQKYKYNGKEWQEEFNLNVTAMDFRQYDNALGRFYCPDALSELAYNQTPYRFGFNNPAFWSDPSGLFESWGAANDHKMRYGLANAQINYNSDKGVYQIENEGYTFYEVGSDIISMYGTDSAGIIVNIIKGGGVSGVGPDGGIGNGNFNFLGFSTQDIGTITTAGGIFTTSLEAYTNANSNYQYKYASQTHSAEQLTKLNKARMDNIAKGAKNLGRALGVAGAAMSIYDAFENPSTANIIKASISTGLLLVRINPVVGIALGILDLTGASDHIYNGMGTIIDNY